MQDKLKSLVMFVITMMKRLLTEECTKPITCDKLRNALMTECM